MNIYSYGAVIVIAALCTVMLKKKNPEISMALSIAAVTVVFFAGVDYVDDVVSSIKSFENFDSDYINIPLKILGLNIFTKICQSVCEDVGEKTLSASIGIVSKIACLLIAIPLFEQLLEEIKVILLL